MGAIDHVDLLEFIDWDEFCEGQVFIWLLQLVRCFWINLPLRIHIPDFFFWALIWITPECDLADL
jgi:hypothetical protein